MTDLTKNKDTISICINTYMTMTNVFTIVLIKKKYIPFGIDNKHKIW